ncbi:hypothetical protein NL676_032023 [Syzygium grande]|nr:hypothetical protein NL676_032023 [Syzygium grande]
MGRLAVDEPERLRYRVWGQFSEAALRHQIMAGGGGETMVSGLFDSSSQKKNVEMQNKVECKTAKLDGKSTDKFAI